jgi:hypothetical protein
LEFESATQSFLISKYKAYASGRSVIASEKGSKTFCGPSEFRDFLSYFLKELIAEKLKLLTPWIPWSASPSAIASTFSISTRLAA